MLYYSYVNPNVFVKGQINKLKLIVLQGKRPTRNYFRSYGVVKGMQAKFRPLAIEQGGIFIVPHLL